MNREIYIELDKRLTQELKAHRLRHQVECDDECSGYRLVDALSCNDDISTGIEEIESIVELVLDVYAEFNKGAHPWF